MKKITAVIVNWKREKNLETIANGINCDLIEEVVVFNNNPDQALSMKSATVINSKKNWRCWAKYIVGQMVRTEWVLSMDDDILVTPGIVKRFLGLAEKDPEGIYGLFGVNLAGNSYSGGKRIICDRLDCAKEVDVLLGRVIFCKPEKMAQATYSRSLIDRYREKPHIFEESEDIILTIANSQAGYKNYVIPAKEGIDYRNLPERGQSLFRRKNHMANRDAAVSEMRGGNHVS